MAAGMATGEILGALAMTEPGAGSDLRGAKTTAKKVEGGYLVNGAKTFISSGKTADVIVTFVKTGEGNKAGRVQPAADRERHGRASITARSCTRWASTGTTPPSSRSAMSSCPTTTSSAARRVWASSSS